MKQNGKSGAENNMCKNLIYDKSDVQIVQIKELFNSNTRRLM